jgi:hypothetical protein
MDFALFAHNLLLPNVAIKKFGIGHIVVLHLVIVAGNQKLNGIAIGRTIIL